MSGNSSVLLWWSVKYEKVCPPEYQAVVEATFELSRYFEYHYRERPHLPVDGHTPMEVYGVMTHRSDCATNTPMAGVPSGRPPVFLHGHLTIGQAGEYALTYPNARPAHGEELMAKGSARTTKKCASRTFFKWALPIFVFTLIGMFIFCYDQYSDNRLRDRLAIPGVTITMQPRWPEFINDFLRVVELPLPELISGFMMSRKNYSNAEIDRIVDNLPSARHLVEIQFRGIQVSRQLLESIRDQDSLAVIEFRDCIFDEGLISRVGVSAKIQSLRILGDSAIGDADLRAIAKSRNLKHLELHSSEITDHGIASLGNLKYLKHLAVTSTRITQESFGNIKKLKQLEYLWIEGTACSLSSIRALARGSALKYIAMRSVGSKGDLKKLAREFPAIEFSVMGRELGNGVYSFPLD